VSPRPPVPVLSVVAVIAIMTAVLDVLVWYGTTTWVDSRPMTEEERKGVVENGAGLAIAASVFAISVAAGLWRGSRTTRNVAVIVGALLCSFFGYIATTAMLTNDTGAAVALAGGLMTAAPWAGLTTLLVIPASSKQWFKP
jgi:hypothetical protein